MEHLTAEMSRLGDEIAKVSAHLDAATAHLLDLIRDFDLKGGWNNGFRSCSEWLSWRAGLDRGAARERVRVARALGTLPRLAQVLARGQLSYSKVRAMTRVATPETKERLLAIGKAGTAEHVERIVRGWRHVDRSAEVSETARRHTSRTLHVYQDEDGMLVIRGRLAPEVGAVLVQALTAARETLYQQARTNAASGDVLAETPTMAQQQADALGLLAEAALHHGIDPGSPAGRYQVVVHVDASVLADAVAPGQFVLEDGRRVSAETSRRLACDATRMVIRHDADGRITEVGARTRTIPPPYDVRFSIGIAAAASRVAVCHSRRGITSAIGRTAARRRCPISRCCAVATTARSTKRAIRSSDSRTASCTSAGRMAN